MHTSIKLLITVAVLSSLLVINNCSNEGGPNIGGEAVTLDLGSAGEITTRANEAVSKIISLHLFNTAPGDKPAVALMTLLCSDITISSLPVATSGNGIKAQQANGSVNIRFSVVAAQPGFFKSQPAPLADYDLKVSPDKITLSHSSSEVPSQAIDVLLKNNVNVTMEVKADFDAKLTVKQADLTFGPSAKTVPPALGDEEIDNFFNNMDPTPDEPEPSLMAGCWQLRFVPLEASDGNVPEDPVYAYYEFNEAGGLQRFWNVIPEGEQLTINESYRFPPLQNVDAFIAQSVELVDGKATAQLTQLESRTLLDEETGTVTFGWLSELKGGVKLNASPDMSNDMRRIQGIKIRDAFLLGDPRDSLIGEFELLEKTEIVSGTGDKSEKYKTITGAFTAFTIDCPDPSLPNVFSQEEQVTDDSTTTTSVVTTTTTGLRFMDNGNGTVTDTRTGLIWLKNANPCELKNWADAGTYCSSLKSGDAGLTDGSVAGQWRLPSVQELEGIGTDPPTTYCIDDASCQDMFCPVTWTIPGAPFTDVWREYYWSGTSCAGNAGYAWTVYMNYGYVYSYGKSGGSPFIWPVRNSK